MATRLADRLEMMDKEINAWRNATRKKLLFRLATLNITDRLGLAGSVRSGIVRKDGDIERVYFRFARHGIFIEHGVGRGRPRGSAKARALQQPWLGVVLPDEVDTLADLLAENYADIAVAELKFVIPGIINTRIGGVKYPEYLETVDDQGRNVKVAIDPSFF